MEIMYPILETKRMILKPLQESDFDNMFKIVSDPNVIATTEWNLENDPKIYKKEFTEQVNSGAFFAIKKKKTDEFIGFFILKNYIDIKKNLIKYSHYDHNIRKILGEKDFVQKLQKKCYILLSWLLKLPGFVQTN
jgi:RimJ/RimL family protein N-acetyltransferase